MTDEIITEMFLRRSEDAIAEAERKYGRYLYAVAAGILKNGEDAKETVNEVLLKAWRAIPPERPRDLRAYLASLARRTALNRLEAESAAKRGGGVLREALDAYTELLSAHKGEELVYLYVGSVEAIATPSGRVVTPDGKTYSESSEAYEYFKFPQNTYIP